MFYLFLEDVKERGLVHIIEVAEESTLSCLVGSLQCFQVLVGSSSIILHF